MNRFLLIAVALVFAQISLAQEWAKKHVDASPRHLEWVAIKYGARTVNAFVAYPEVNKKVPVIVMIHEIFGMSDWAMMMADQLAEAGYIVVAPDFLSGMGPNGGGTSSLEPGDIRTAMSALTPDQIDADLDAACDFAKRIPSGNGKVVVGGFCWGGQQTFRFATKRQDLTAALVFYGPGPTDEEALKRINCPVYGFYGGNDNRVNATIPEIERLMKANGKTYEPVIYESGGHGFMRAGVQPDASEGNAKARTAGWARLMEILGALR